MKWDIQQKLSATRKKEELRNFTIKIDVKQIT